MLQLKSTFNNNVKPRKPYFPVVSPETTADDVNLEDFQPFMKERDKLGHLSTKKSMQMFQMTQTNGKQNLSTKSQSLIPKKHHNLMNVSKIQEKLQNNQIPNSSSSQKTIQFKTQDARIKRYHISENMYQVQDVNRPTFVFVDIASPFLKNSRFIETYQPLPHSRMKLAKQIFESYSKHIRHPLRKKKGRFYTDFSLIDNPPVGYYQYKNNQNESQQHHFSKQNRTFDWQHLPHYESKQEYIETPFILIQDNEEKQLVRELKQSLKHYASESTLLKPVQNQLQMKLINFDEGVMKSMSDQLNRLRQTAKKLRNEISVMTEVQIQKLNASEKQQTKAKKSSFSMALSSNQTIQ